MGVIWLLKREVSGWGRVFESGGRGVVMGLGLRGVAEVETNRRFMGRLLHLY